jgi:ATP-dependent DNA helicase RecG
LEGGNQNQNGSFQPWALGFLSFIPMSDLSRLEGVGPKRKKLLAEAGIHTLRDLVYHLPRRYIDRTRFTQIADLEVGKDAIFPAKVIGLSIIQTRMVVEVEDETGTMELLFFNGVQFLRNRFFEGQRILVAGVPSFFREIQIVHPEWEAIVEGQELKGSILSRYPLTMDMAAGHVEHKFLQRICLAALDQFAFSDPLAEKDRKALGLISESEMLRGLHHPATMEEIPPLRRQLKVRELLPLALRLEVLKLQRQNIGRSWPSSSNLKASLLKSFPFSLTVGQGEVLESISRGQASKSQFCGLLQGDVGSGKTVVALLAAANVLEAGGQVALLAPTEILASQHLQTLTPWLTQAGVAAGLLMGSTNRGERESLLTRLASGQVSFIIGTHALYSADVKFKNLGLVIIDEQHRFGVQQRQAMADKGENPDILYMSATPIPRTLAQTVFGDLENLVLKEKPAGRLPVKTRIVPANKRRDMLSFLLKEALGGNQVYWVVPQIGKSQVIEKPQDPDIFVPEIRRPEMAKISEEVKISGEDIATLEQVEKELKAFSPDWKVGIVHGRLPSEHKEAVLKAFRAGELHLLLATTVIEVGVDVPAANLMVIEGPDRFGLAQLHQLRGRTGRGLVQAWCFLAMPDREWPPETLERLTGFSETNDGFQIAEMDLKNRGTGNLEGTDQSGYGALKFTDLLEDFNLTQEIRQYARQSLESMH